MTCTATKVQRSSNNHTDNLQLAGWIQVKQEMLMISHSLTQTLSVDRHEGLQQLDCVNYRRRTQKWPQMEAYHLHYRKVLHG
jgi:hypothetical protein